MIQRIVKLLTRTGYLIEEQGMRCLVEARRDRRVVCTVMPDTVPNPPA